MSLKISNRNRMWELIFQWPTESFRNYCVSIIWRNAQFETPFSSHNETTENIFWVIKILRVYYLSDWNLIILRLRIKLFSITHHISNSMSKSLYLPFWITCWSRTCSRWSNENSGPWFSDYKCAENFSVLNFFPANISHNIWLLFNLSMLINNHCQHGIKLILYA